MRRAASGPVIRPFHDRVDAGRRLASELRNYEDRPEVIVLALPRGGVPVGFEVTSALHAPLDVFVVRKLGLPWHEELAMGAIASGGAEGGAPVRGQLVVVEPQPEIDYMVVAPREGLYMLPRRDGIVLGTTHERGSWELAPRAAETARLLAGHAALLGPAR